MKILKIYYSEFNWTKVHEVVLLLLLLMLIWWSAPWWIYHLDKSAAWVDAGIWSLVIIAVITFILLLLLCWFLLNSCWEALALPACQSMVLSFKQLELWQQFAFYWASFALLLLAAVATLAAIC